MGSIKNFIICVSIFILSFDNIKSSQDSKRLLTTEETTQRDKVQGGILSGEQKLAIIERIKKHM